MKDLIKITQTQIGAESLNAVNARDLHKALEIKKAFTTWITTALDNTGAIEGEDYIKLKSSLEGSGYQIDYIITMDIGKHIAMMSKVVKGKEVRDYFIKCEKDLNKPMTIEQLLENNIKVIKQLQNDKMVLVAQNKVMKPKALFADSVAQSEQSLLIGQFAKAICDDNFKIGQNKLFAWLRENNYLIKSGERYNQPMQKYIDNGYFEVVERTVVNPDGSTRITVTTKIKGLGQINITNKLKGQL